MTGIFGAHRAHGFTPDPAENWTTRGACRTPGTNPEWFWPTGTRLNHDNKRALRLCGSCQVSQRCLQYALDRGENEGIWGGTTEPERRAIIRAGGMPPVRVHGPGAARAAKTHCPRGHAYDDNNTYHDPGNGPRHGARHCRACRREVVARSRAKVRSAS